jgi:hypothetical protein
VLDKRGDRFILNSLTLCNGDHKETIWINIKGQWGDGDYCGEETYRLKCWNALQRGIIMSEMIT